MTALKLMVCPDCAAPRLFEQPGCAPEHGVDCVERCCTECGAAVFIGGTGGIAASSTVPDVTDLDATHLDANDMCDVSGVAPSAVLPPDSRRAA